MNMIIVEFGSLQVQHLEAILGKMLIEALFVLPFPESQCCICEPFQGSECQHNLVIVDTFLEIYVDAMKPGNFDKSKISLIFGNKY